MSSIRIRLLPFIKRCHPEVFRGGIDSKVTFHCPFGLRKLSTESGQGDDPSDEGNMMKRKLQKAAKKITDKVGGEEGEKMKDSLMKMVSLQSEENKEPSSNVMKNISNILKDIPIEVSKKMTTGMDSKRNKSFTDNRKEGSYRTWKERPPKLDEFRQRQFSEPQRDNRESREFDGGYSRPQERVNFALAKPLNLFENKPSNGDYYTLKVWNKIREEEMDLAFRQPARNTYDEMIQLTRAGKLWSFPIDNEAGLEEEAKVPFYEHTILDHLLEDLPPSGPVREFIELITIGVSNNPYITVERKHAVIGWYVDFFKEKEPILRECGAL